ncbi:MAG: thermonuclease family protein [Pseudomonadota bacterium]
MNIMHRTGRALGLLFFCTLIILALSLEPGGQPVGARTLEREPAPRAASSAPRERSAEVTRVIDGDTFVIEGGARVRVRNFDTPERRRFACSEEKEAAEAATRAARALLHRQRVALSISGEDRYGRLIADVRLLLPNRQRSLSGAGAQSSDFVERMVSSGHGARWDYGREPQPDWCPRRDWWDALSF